MLLPKASEPTTNASLDEVPMQLQAATLGDEEIEDREDAEAQDEGQRESRHLHPELGVQEGVVPILEIQHVQLLEDRSCTPPRPGRSEQAGYNNNSLRTSEHV